MPRITLEVTPELGRWLDAWSKEFEEPPESLAIGLLEEYFEDSDTGARISDDVAVGRMATYPLAQVRQELELAD